MAVDFVQPREVAPVQERPVFAAQSPHRPRALRIGGRAAAILTGLWVVALAIGAFGFGYLPGFQLPSSHTSSPSPAPAGTAGAGHGSAGPAAADALGKIARTARAGGLTGSPARPTVSSRSQGSWHRTHSG